MHGLEIGGSMGLTTWAAFSGTDQLAAVDGDFIMTANEVQPVLKTPRKNGIHGVALHNHMSGEEPAFYFTHFWGKGPAEKLAAGVKAALDDGWRRTRPLGMTAVATVRRLLHFLGLDATAPPIHHSSRFYHLRSRKRSGRQKITPSHHDFSSRLSRA